ncbi:MAG: TetR/AcrR family transcriptional regulator, partial [Pseudomonadota bacterium]
MEDLKKKSKTYHHGDLKGALLEGVRQLIERDGADAFKVSEACRIAGVSTAAPYKHFKDRDEIIHAVALAGMQRLGARMQVAAGSFSAGDPRRIEAIGRAYLDFAADEPGVFRLVFGLADDHGEDAALTETGNRTSGFVSQLVSEHLGLPLESEEVQLRAYALWCFVHGHA